MLIGEYPCSLDAKGRVNFPAKLKGDLGDRFIIARGLDKPCLFVYSLSEWQVMEEKIKSLPLSKAGSLQRFFFASAGEVEPDKQGRIVLPANLREYGKLEKDVVVIGASTRCEIWSKENWAGVCEEISQQALTSVMDELGF